jgi:hypothetical protein
MTRVRSDGARSSPSLSFRWDAKLTRPLQVRDGPKLETLADASRHIVKLPWRYQRHQALFLTHMLVLEAIQPRAARDLCRAALGDKLPGTPVPFSTWRCNEKEARFVPCC